MAVINCVRIRKAGAMKIAIAIYFNFLIRLNSKDSNGTANRCIDNPLLRYLWLFKVTAMRLIA